MALGLLAIHPAQGAERVHHWAFEGNTLDSSPSGNDGAVTGQISYTDGVLGQALVLDALDDLVEDADADNLPLEPEDPWSMNVWYNLGNFPSLAYGGGFGDRFNNSTIRAYLSFGPAAGGEDNAFYFWGANIDVYAGASYETDSAWHMYTITFDGENMKMYKDATEVIETDIDKQGDFIADDFAIRGTLPPIVSVGGPSLWNQYVDGAVDEFAIWNGALTAEEILSLYNDTGTLPGDFNDSGVLDAADIDDLSGQAAGGNNPSAYDLDNDALVNESDVNVWVKDLFNSWIGDANLDGEFDSSDLVQVLASGTYEANTPSVWTSGDFNGDGRSDSADLVAALADGGYEGGPRAATAAVVPEPTTAWLAALGLGAFLTLGRRARRRAGTWHWLSITVAW
jgi:hypothetical protein